MKRVAGLAWWVALGMGGSVLAQPAPLSSFRDCATCPELVSLPGGRYRMGSPADEPEHDLTEGLRHGVRIPPFAIGRFEVTVAEYQVCVSAGVCAGPAWQVQNHPGTQDPEKAFVRGLFDKLGASVAVPSHPVTGVSWHMARQYTDWLSQTTGQRYHLPSETQWEYAARAGTLTRWSFGDDPAQAGTHAWLGSNSASALHPVGSHRPNPWGLHDVHGSVWEWTQDCYEHWSTYEHWDPRWDGAPRDERAWETERCPNRVMRGGSWNDGAERLRSAERAYNGAGHTTPVTGFRVARHLP